jgi:hypothetical protein
VILCAAGCGGPDQTPDAGPSLDVPEPGERPPVPRPQGPHAGYRDESEGVVATLVYVTETKEADGAARPSALVFCSDPEHKLFHRKPTTRVNVKRMFRDQMELLLGDLRERGFDSLPWKPQDYELEHGSQRAFYLYRDGKRRVVYKQILDEAGLRTFSQIERLLINATMAVD